VTLELGGNAGVIIADDADLAYAADAAPLATSPMRTDLHFSQRIFVHSGIYDEFTERFLALTRKLRVAIRWMKRPTSADD